MVLLTKCCCSSHIDHSMHISLSQQVFCHPCPHLWHSKHHQGFGIYGKTGIFKYPALIDWGSVKSKDQSVRWNNFVISTNLYLPDENNTLRGYFHKFPQTIPSNLLTLSHPLMYWETNGATWIGMLHRIFDLRFLEWFSMAHSTKREPFLNFLAHQPSPFYTANKDSFHKDSSSEDPMTRKLNKCKDI